MITGLDMRGVMGADAIRAYVRGLRDGRGITQTQIAKELGITLRTYQMWETGETAELKASLLVRAIRFLRGSFAILGELSTPESGVAAAAAWLAQEREDARTESEETQRQTVHIYRRLADLIEAGTDPATALQIVESELQHGLPSAAPASDQSTGRAGSKTRSRRQG